MAQHLKTLTAAAAAAEERKKDRDTLNALAAENFKRDDHHSLTRTHAFIPMRAAFSCQISARTRLEFYTLSEGGMEVRVLEDGVLKFAGYLRESRCGSTYEIGQSVYFSRGSSYIPPFRSIYRALSTKRFYELSKAA